MVDPLSIVANVIGIAAFCGKLADSTGRFVVDTKDAPQIISEYYETIRNLQSALLNLGHVLEERPSPQNFERDHYQNIGQIVLSCKAALERLDSRLPAVPDDPSVLAKTRLNFAMSLRSNSIQQTVTHIGSYTQVLHLSLISLSLGTLWGTQQSHAEIQAQIRNLEDSIRSANIGMLGPDTASQNQLPEMEAEVAEANLAVAQEIQAWRVTADQVVVSVSVYSPDVLSLDGRPPRGEPSDSGIDIASEPEITPFDPDPEARRRGPSRHILQLQLEQNQKMVLQLVDSGIYAKASYYQRKAIRRKEQLAEIHMVPFDYNERASMNEYLVDILLKKGTKDSRIEGREILKAQLSEACNRANQGMEVPDPDRVSRLYHKLGNVFFDEGDLGQAITMLERAFDGRAGREPVPTQLAIESARSIAKAHQLNGDFDDAAGYLEWIHQTLRPATNPEKDPLQHPPETGDMAFAWCKEKGFDVEAPDFCFDACDLVKGTSPLHLAVKTENLDVLRQMVSQVVNFERRDTESATPLLLAAGTPNYKTTTLLLDHGAKIDVCDHSGKTPLHRCQVRKGGVKVAKLLLERQRDLANAQDNTSRTALFMAAENGNLEMAELLLGKYGAEPDLKEGYGRTPLFRACELGLEKMVRLLLDHGAQPNIRGPGLCTPLKAAIDDAGSIGSKMPIVEMLLARGAEPAMADADGQDAFDAADKAGFATELKSLLHKGDARRLSSVSSASNGSRSSKNSWGSQSSRANKSFGRWWSSR